VRILDKGIFSNGDDLVIDDVLTIDGVPASNGDLISGDLTSGGDIVLIFRLYIPLCTDNHFLTLDDIVLEKSGVVETS